MKNKKLLIIHSIKGELENISQAIKEGAQKKGYEVDILNTKIRNKTVSFFPYDYVLVGSPTIGFFKGKAAEDISSFLKKCKRTQGQETVAFVTPRFFATTKALKDLMGHLEKQGCLVNDFRTFRSYKQALKYGESL